MLQGDMKPTAEEMERSTRGAKFLRLARMTPPPEDLKGAFAEGLKSNFRGAVLGSVLRSSVKRSTVVGCSKRSLRSSGERVGLGTDGGMIDEEGAAVEVEFWRGCRGEAEMHVAAQRAVRRRDVYIMIE